MQRFSLLICDCHRDIIFIQYRLLQSVILLEIDRISLMHDVEYYRKRIDNLMEYAERLRIQKVAKDLIGIRL